MDVEAKAKLIDAARGGRAADVLQLVLLSVYEEDIDCTDENGWTPLMWASYVGHVECMHLVLNSGAQTNHEDKDGCTPLLWASYAGHVKCVQLLLDKGAQANHEDKNGWTPLLSASSRGYAECVQLLLERGAVVNHQTKSGWTPLMEASDQGHFECVQLLLKSGAQANLQNKAGDTALHLAAALDWADYVRLFLSQPGIDVNIKNNEGRTAMMDAGYKSLDVFNQVLKTFKDFPADSYGKVVLCGNSGAGKSTLTQAIINLSKPKRTRLIKRVFGRQEAVEPLTAGIDPHQVDSHYSNMVIYDLAGHQQYFSSHSAYLEAITCNSPAIFLLLQDIRKDLEAITKELYYWSTMIDGVCHKCPQKSSVIVMGTHTDLLTPEQLTTKLGHLQTVAMEAISHQKLIKILALNLTKIYRDEMDQFMNLLHETNKDVVSMCPLISMMCHMLLAFLKQKLHPTVDAISLTDLLVNLDTDQHRFIYPDMLHVTPLLETLSEKGLIVFIPSERPRNNWIVLHKEGILKKVNGTLFADEKYKRLASNTGIIPKEILEKAFQEYNIEMIIQFLIHFELCQSVDLSEAITNMSPESSSSSDLRSLLFFPALVSVDMPNDAMVSNNSFHWSIIVKHTNQFFTPRFLHVLLCRLPFEFALPTVQGTPLHPHLSRACEVWSRGIKWLSETGVTTIVEMREMFQSLSLATSFPDRTNPNYLELTHSVLAVIKKACQEFCPYVEVLEIISCPPEASSDHSDDTRVELSLLKKALLGGDKHIVDVKRKTFVNIEEWKKIEPCLAHLVGVSTSKELSPSSQLMAEPAGQVVLKVEAQLTMEQLLHFTARTRIFNVAALVGIAYSKMGVFLLKDETGAIVQALENEHMRNAEKINMAIFTQWLQGKGAQPITWSTLIDVLRKIGMCVLADDIEEVMM